MDREWMASQNAVASIPMNSYHDGEDQVEEIEQGAAMHQMGYRNQMALPAPASRPQSHQSNHGLMVASNYHQGGADNYNNNW